MDSLTIIQARIAELIDAKIERKAALLAEIETIDKEIAEARSILERWNVAPVSTINPVKAIREPKEVKPIRMPRDGVIAFIRSKGGPCHSQEILSHFGLTDGRASVVFRVWAKTGDLVSCGDGFYNVPGPVAVEKLA